MPQTLCPGLVSADSPTPCPTKYLRPIFMFENSRKISKIFDFQNCYIIERG